MNGAWPDRYLRLVVIGLVTLLGASTLLLAQAAGDKGKQELWKGPGQAATSQPADKTSLIKPLTEAGPDAATPEEIPGRLLSGLIGSKHDFTAEGRHGRDLCLPCHTPHLLRVPPPRLNGRPATTQPLRPYQDIEVELDGWSLLCLGCHDGVTAQDVYSTSHATTIAGQLGDSPLGTRGLRSHPVGIKYTPVADDYHPLAAAEAAGLLIPNGRIQCATCHDAHNTNRHAGMLRISNERSRMCLTCHRL